MIIKHERGLNMQDIIDLMNSTIKSCYEVEYDLLNPRLLKIKVKANENTCIYIIHSYTEQESCVFHICNKISQDNFDEIFNTNIIDSINAELLKFSHDISFLYSYCLGKKTNLEHVNHIDKTINETHLGTGKGFTKDDLEVILYNISENVLFRDDILKIQHSIRFEPDINSFKYQSWYHINGYQFKFRTIELLKDHIINVYATTHLDKRKDELLLIDSQILKMADL